MHKIFKILAFVLAIAGIIFAVLIANGSESQISSMLYVAYVTLAIVLISAVLFSLINLFSNPATLKNTLISVGAFLLLALICYFVFAQGVETPLKEGGSLSASGSKLIGAGLYLFYALILIAAGLMLFTGVKKMIK